MKRILLLISVVLACNGVFAQGGTSKTTNFKALEKKIAKSNDDIQNPKKMAKDGTWLSRAELMVDVYNAQILNAYADMPVETFNLIVGKPNEQTNLDIDGMSTDKFIMDRVDFFFVEGKLYNWLVTKPLLENPLDEALKSLQKAIELDKKGKRSKKITDQLIALKRLFTDEGLNSYKTKDYLKACEFFKQNIVVATLPQVNTIDTPIYFYAGLSAQLGQDYKQAIELYQKSIELGYTESGSVYYNIYDAYKQLGDENTGVKYLEDGLIKNPQNLNILFSLINSYLVHGEDPTKIIHYIDQALKDTPDNYSLYFAKGTLYDKLEQYDKAIADYKKAIEIKPDHFNSYYNIGAVYYNMGVSLTEEASKIPPSKLKEYDALMAQAQERFKESLPYMIKAAEIDPQSVDAIEAVKNLYFRFRNESDEMMQQYKKYDDMLKSLKQ